MEMKEALEICAMNMKEFNPISPLKGGWEVIFMGERHCFVFKNRAYEGFGRHNEHCRKPNGKRHGWGESFDKTMLEEAQRRGIHQIFLFHGYNQAKYRKSLEAVVDYAIRNKTVCRNFPNTIAVPLSLLDPIHDKQKNEEIKPPKDNGQRRLF